METILDCAINYWIVNPYLIPRWWKWKCVQWYRVQIKISCFPLFQLSNTSEFCVEFLVWFTKAEVDTWKLKNSTNDKIPNLALGYPASFIEVSTKSLSLSLSVCVCVCVCKVRLGFFGKDLEVNSSHSNSMLWNTNWKSTLFKLITPLGVPKIKCFKCFSYASSKHKVDNLNSELISLTMKYIWNLTKNDG